MHTALMLVSEINKTIFKMRIESPMENARANSTASGHSPRVCNSPDSMANKDFPVFSFNMSEEVRNALL